MHKDNKKHYNQTLLAFFFASFLKKNIFFCKKPLCSTHKSISNNKLPTTQIHNPRHLINITKSNSKHRRKQIKKL